MVAAGVLIYAAVGLAGILAGGHYLDYSVLSSDPIHGQHRSGLGVGNLVAVTVCGVMLKIYYMLLHAAVRRISGAGAFHQYHYPFS